MNNTTTPVRNREEPKAPSMSQMGSEAKAKAQEVGHQAMDKAKDFAAQATDKAKDLASQAADKAKGFASQAADKADDAAGAVGSGMKSLAGTIKDKLPHDGMIGSATSAVAHSLEKGGRYLQEEGVSGIADELTNLVRRNPIPALFIGIGIGYLVARSMRS